MKPKPNPELIDDDNPEWTKEDFARAIPFNQLPSLLKETLASRRRGPQKAPTKVQISLRLSPEVLQHYKATGAGWQARIDEALQKAVAGKARSSTKRKAAITKPVTRRAKARTA